MTPRPDGYDIVDHYRDQGYAVAKSVIDSSLILELDDHVSWLQQRYPDVRPEQLSHMLVADDPFWCRVVSDDRLLDLAEKFIGPDIALFASSYFSKPARDGMPVLWHQDGSYWPIDPPEAVVTLWLAIDRSDAGNGCLQVIPGSHRGDLHEVTAQTDVANVLGSTLDPRLVDASAARDVCLNPGDVSIHHPQTIHGSRANNCNRRRCGLAIRYIPASARISRDVSGQRGEFSRDDKYWPQGKWPCCFHLRGERFDGVNDYAEFPKFDRSRHMPFSGCEVWR